MLNITSLIFYNFLNMRTKSKHRQEALKKSLSQLLQIQKKHLPLQPQSREIATIKWNDGALVQLVRIHACHAWGHGFESRTHRWDSRTTESLKATKSTISINCGLFLYSASANPRTSNSPLRTKFRYQIVTEKLPSVDTNWKVRQYSSWKLRHHRISIMTFV